MSEPAVEGMTREELVAYIRDLEGAVEDLRELSGKRGADVNRRMSDIEQQLEDLQTAVSNHGEQIDAMADVGTAKTTKDEKVATIAAFALKKAGNKRGKVLVEPGEVRGCTGVTRRYAYDLIDAIGEDDACDWGEVRKPKSVPTGKGKRRKVKGLAVDCDRLRKSSHAPDGVNKFTTTSDEEGG